MNPPRISRFACFGRALSWHSQSETVVDDFAEKWAFNNNFSPQWSHEEPHSAKIHSVSSFNYPRGRFECKQNIFFNWTCLQTEKQTKKSFVKGKVVSRLPRQFASKSNDEFEAKSPTSQNDSVPSFAFHYRQATTRRPNVYSPWRRSSWFSRSNCILVTCLDYSPRKTRSECKNPKEPVAVWHWPSFDLRLHSLHSDEAWRCRNRRTMESRTHQPKISPEL